MSDPFVKRMLARSQARRNVMSKIGEDSNKENSKKSEDVVLSCRTVKSSTNSSPTNTYDSKEFKSILNFEKNSTSEALQDNSNNKTLSPRHFSSSLSHQQNPEPGFHHSNNSNTTRSRFQQLAQRSKDIDQWEDDYSYHSISCGTSKEEAQGFTPSDSRSKLSYDFKERDRSPIKQDSRLSPIRKTPNTFNQSSICSSIDGSRRSPYKSTNKYCSPELAVKLRYGPPKILSIQPKVTPSQVNNEACASEQKKVRERSLSPSKVGDMRKQWEQHIREASPERPTARSSPDVSSVPIINHDAAIKSRCRSPLKSEPAISAFRNTCRTSPPKFSSHYISPSKKSDYLSPNRGSVDVIKGEAPMPETKPLLASSAASVKERVAAFASISEKLVPVRDPAEMSIQDRKNIFETKKGFALTPKAPFGQCVSEKQIMTDKPATSKSYELPAVSKGNSKCNKTYICSETNSTDSVGNLKSRSSSVNVYKKRFEKVEENDWKMTDINSKVANDRKQEMEILLNRFKKPRNDVETQSYENPIALQQHESESDTEYPESESSLESDCLSAALLMGPPKPPRTPGVFLQPPSPTHTSPSRRFNSTEVGESSPPSPRKIYVPKVNPGCLFPSLSDIESQSEALESDEDNNKNSSFAESVLTCASMDSLGGEIRRMAQANNSSRNQTGLCNTHLSTISEGETDIKATIDQPSMSASTLEAIGAIDDALEEAFSDDTEPTPPKRLRTRDEGSSGSVSVYKNPKMGNSSTSSSDSSEVALAHTVSMYRKQKPADVTVTPVRQMTRISEMSSPHDSPVSPSVTISSRIRRLQAEEEHQLTVISQASSAISVVSQHPQQHGTTQHIEAEKLLLVATQKRQAILHEIQRLKAEGALGKRSFWSDDDDSCRGSLSITNVTLPLKQDFLNKLNENQTHYFVVMVKHRDQVITSQLQTTPECIVEGAVTFPNLMALHNLAADFNISLEVYGFKVEPSQAHGYKKDHSRLKLTPLKRLHREVKSCNSPSTVSSPGGPFAVRTSSFQLIGFANLNINTLTRNAWTLEKVPFNSPMNGHLLMRVAVTMEGGATERSFLTLFDDVGGFGAWNRRWCVLSGPFIKYWSYPDDENRKDCIGVLDLRLCTTRKVELVSRDVCARQFTFQLTFMRPLQPGDRSDLVHEVKNNVLISRFLLSADGKEERILWCNKLNQALANIRAWDPDALKPEDFHV